MKKNTEELTVADLFSAKINCNLTVSSLNLNTYLYISNRNELRITETEETPIEESVVKTLKNLPIIVLGITQKEGNNNVMRIIKGGSDVKNLIRWATTKEPIVIEEREIRFSEFDKEEKEYFLRRKNIITCLVEDSYGTLSEYEISKCLKRFCG